VRLEGLGQLKNQTRDLPASSIVRQPTTLPRGIRIPVGKIKDFDNFLVHFLVTRVVLKSVACWIVNLCSSGESPTYSEEHMTSIFRFKK
jgi:hypothetical protein